MARGCHRLLPRFETEPHTVIITIDGRSQGALDACTEWLQVQLRTKSIYGLRRQGAEPDVVEILGATHRTPVCSEDSRAARPHPLRAELDTLCVSTWRHVAAPDQRQAAHRI